MLFIIGLCGSAYGGNASQANKANYHISVLHHHLTFYIVMFKKEKFIPQMCILFYNQLWAGVWEYGGARREGIFTVNADGNL